MLISFHKPKNIYRSHFSGKHYSVVHEDSKKQIWFIITFNGHISQVFYFSGISNSKGLQKQFSLITTGHNYHALLTLCPFSPGSPGSPSKPLSPYKEIQQRMLPDRTAPSHIKVIMHCTMQGAMLYDSNTLFRISDINMNSCVLSWVTLDPDSPGIPRDPSAPARPWKH